MRISQSRTPRPLIDCVNAQWALNVLEECGLSEDDVMDYKASTDFEKRKSELALEWWPIVDSIKNSEALKDNLYWSIWIKKQNRIGRNWVGTGEMLIKLPELYLLLKVTDNIITQILVSVITEISYPSSWYLNSLFESNCYWSNTMTLSEYFNLGDNYLGIDSNKNWHMALKNKILKGYKVDLDSSLPFLIDTNKNIYKRSRKNFVLSRGKEYEVNILISLNLSDISNIRKYFSPTKIISKQTDDKIKKIDTKISLNIQYKSDIFYGASTRSHKKH